MLRVAASFWKALSRYWRMGNLRADGLGTITVVRMQLQFTSWRNIPPGFLGVDVVSAVRGKALLMRVEKESIIISPVLGGG